ITFDRCIDKLFDLGKSDDLVEFALYFSPFHPENCAIENNIFTSGQLRMKSRPHLQQRTDSASNLSVAGRRFGNAREDFEQSAFPAAVTPDEADYVACFKLACDCR